MLTCPAAPIKSADRRPVERVGGPGERPVREAASQVSRNPIVLSW